jgi:hypothetical protein
MGTTGLDGSGVGARQAAAGTSGSAVGSPVVSAAFTFGAMVRRRGDVREPASKSVAAVALEGADKVCD